MSLLDKDVTEDIARGIRTVHEAAKDGIETAAARGATRLRSGAKTRKSAATREKIRWQPPPSSWWSVATPTSR